MHTMDWIKTIGSSFKNGLSAARWPLAVMMMLTLCCGLTSPLFAYFDRETPIVKVVQEWGPAVVNISTEKVISLRDDPFWHGYGEAYDFMLQHFNRQQGEPRVKLLSIGSGVVVDENGLIITNAHVIKMAGNIYVTLQDGTRLEAKLRYIRHQDDLALLEVEPSAPLKAINIADPQDILIGESVIAIGNPFGLENSVSAGVVSGKSRSFFAAELGHLFNDLVQTDAAINVGNSGGALLNLNGELVGLNLTVAKNAEGIGFAVAADKIRAVVEEFQLADRFHQERQRAIQAAVPE